MKRLFLVCLASLLVVGCQSAAPAADVTATPRGTQSLSPAYTPTPRPTPLPTLPSTPAAVELEDERPHPRYDAVMTLAMDGGRAQLEGSVRLQYINATDDALHSLTFLLLPAVNLPDTTMTAGPALVDGDLLPAAAAGEGLLTVDLRHALSPGAAVDLTLPFSVDTPLAAGGVLFLPAPYPLLMEPPTGQDALSPYAGPLVPSAAGSHQFELTLPEGFQFVTLGRQGSPELLEGGLQRVRAAAEPLRAPVLAAGFFDETVFIAGDVQLHAWTLPANSDEAEALLEDAAVQLEILSGLWGAYPYTELHVIDVPARPAQGWPAMLQVGAFGTNTALEEVPQGIARQWTAGLTASDPLEEPWVSEAFTLYANALYYENAFSIGAATGFLSNLRAVLRASGLAAEPIGQPAHTFASSSEYTLLTAYKGALLLESLRWQMGRTAFFSFMADVFEQNRFGWVTGEELQAAAETACDCALDDVFDLWVREGGPLDIP